MSASTVENYGPSALGGEARRFVELTLTLARTEFKLRYYGSVLGYVWSLMRPLLFFGVLYVFSSRSSRSRRGPYYGAYLLTAIVLWNFLSRRRRVRHRAWSRGRGCCERSASRVWSCRCRCR